MTSGWALHFEGGPFDGLEGSAYLMPPPPDLWVWACRCPASTTCPYGHRPHAARAGLARPADAIRYRLAHAGRRDARYVHDHVLTALRRKEPAMGLDGPSRTIIYEPDEQPAEQPPRVAPEPEREPAPAPEREPEPVGV